MKRRDFLLSSGLATLGFTSGCSKNTTKRTIEHSVTQSGNSISIFSDAVQKKCKIIFAADTHIAVQEKLTPPYDDYASRMGRRRRGPEHLISIIENAQKENADAVILGGDIINYPSKGNIDVVYNAISKSKIPVFYIAGNHDWHFEGDSGSDIEQRQKWLTALKPLYFGNNQLLYSKVIAGVKLLCLDNSTYHILPEQLEDFKQEVSEGLPTIIFAHIPLYFKGRDIWFGCGNPNWNASNDPAWKIERRQRWSESGLSKSTFELYDLFMDTPNILGIFVGHIHKFSSDMANGKFQFVAPTGMKGDFLKINISPM